MKFYKIVFILLTQSLNCHAQDTATVVYSNMFIQQLKILPLSRLKGWFFKPGNDSTWARVETDMSGWQKLAPIELSAKNAGKNGRLEGWFRIKIKLDSSVSVKNISIAYNSFAPADIFIDGKLLGSIGHTGLFGQPYAEHDGHIFDHSLPFALKRGEQFTLALHLVDTLAPFGRGRLKLQWKNSVDLIYLANENSEDLDNLSFFKLKQSEAIWLAVSLILAILLWLTALQNRSERVLFYIACCVTFFVFLTFFQYRALDTTSCLLQIIYSDVSNLSLALILLFFPLIIAAIFKRRKSLPVKLALAALPLTVILTWYLPVSLSKFLKIGDAILLLFPFAISLYYVFSSWKNAKGAQWSIIGGFLATCFFMLCIIVSSIFLPQYIYTTSGLGYYLLMAFVLAFPVSLLVYVAMRFKEIINEVRVNAAEVVRLSEEKKQEALNRQALLEEEVNRQTAEIRAAQAQLIQSEKMASLGELTAGIAHEIQNPLNFVNNFSEVNQEMIDELKDELSRGKLQTAAEIADDIKKNEEKINHHGKRADAIVKSMLEHSRSSTGAKEPTDINKLADEYLKLAYHGMRAKDKNFNVRVVTDFGEKVGKVKIISQDIGRVLLNLFNNAFYTVNKKKAKEGKVYEPMVTVATHKSGDQLFISVSDNGEGIPDSVKDKVFQPFFTTKPTGIGTGLGLSLSYDIVRAHGGKITVTSKQGEGSEFVIVFPLA